MARCSHMELCLVVDHACNLRCSYCYSGEKSTRAMPRDVAERAIELALARDPTGLELSFFGGEPLLHMGLIERATDYAQRRLHELSPGATLVVHLNTNATLVSDRTEAFVKQCQAINAFVSIDGSSRDHDRHRLDVAGRGSHSAVKQGLLRLSAAGARVIALAVVNPDTAANLGVTALELFSLPVARAHVNCNLRASWDDAALHALRAGLRAAGGVWAQAFREGRIIHFEPFTTKILSHLHAAMPCAGRCQLGAQELVVAPSGRLYPCGELVGADDDTRHVIGDIDNGLSVDKLRELRAAKDRVEVTCEACALRERCSSGCGCKHVALTGNFGEITSTLCEIESAIVEAADEVAETLYRENCEAFLEFFYRRQWIVKPETELVQVRRKPVDDLGKDNLSR